MFLAYKKDVAGYGAASPLMSGESLSVTPGSKPPVALLDLDFQGSSSSAELALPLSPRPQASPVSETPSEGGPVNGNNNSGNNQPSSAPAATASPLLNLPLPTLVILPAATPAPPTPNVTSLAPTQTLVAPTATLTASPQPASGNTIVATDYESLSKALAALQEGQTLVVPAGEYPVRGPVYLKSDTEIQFESGSLVRFLGSDDGFVFDSVSNVTVEGMRSYHESTTKTGRNIRTMDASNITLIDTVIERSGSIGMSIDYSHDILIDGYVNTDEAVHPGNVDDALNIRNSHSVRVRNFDLWTSDDAISLKTMGSFNGETYNITIENGVIRSEDSGIAFGSEIAEPIYDVTIRNVEFTNSGNPIYFKRYDESYQSSIENIRIENVWAHGAGTERFFFVHAKSGTANTVRDVTLSDSHFEGNTEFQDFYFQHNDPETNGIVFENVTVNGKEAQP
jgi:polygalacturonase